MGRIIAEVVGNELIVTRYDSDGSVIPNKITQDKEVVAVISRNLDSDYDKDSKIEYSPDELAVSREDFLIKLLGMSNACVERYSVYGKGLYSENDMKRGITWAEVAYLLYYVGGVKRSLDWNNIKPRGIDRVCVLHEVLPNGESTKVLDEKLASYKNRLDMERYIGSIVAGKRYIPLPVYCSYFDLVENPDLEIKLGLDMMFRKMSKAEFEVLF